jgi:hypothetical protein
MNGISVRTKVFLLFSVATLLTVLPALVLISGAVEERVYERATEELIAANDALRTHWRVQDEGLLAGGSRSAPARGHGGSTAYAPTERGSEAGRVRGGLGG